MLEKRKEINSIDKGRYMGYGANLIRIGAFRKYEMLLLVIRDGKLRDIIRKDQIILAQIHKKVRINYQKHAGNEIKIQEYLVCPETQFLNKKK